MFVIENRRANRHWIAGIFTAREDAEAFLGLIVGEDARLVEIASCRYPFFVLESDGFEYGDLFWVQARLRTLPPAADDATILCNLYLVTEDFRPKRPGSDYMGLLQHWHVESSQRRQGAEFAAMLTEAVDYACRKSPPA